MDIVTEKTCRICSKTKPISEYSIRKYKNGAGYRTECKSCIVKKVKEWRENNLERDRKNHRESARKRRSRGDVKEKEKIYRSKNRDSRREKLKEWRKNNPEKTRAQFKKANSLRAIYKTNIEWRKRNPESGKESHKRWLDKNKDKVRHYRKIRRDRNRGAEGKYTIKEWLDLCEKYGNKCLCCGEIKKLTIDHIVPISKGGSNFIENIQPLCLSCNASKKDKTIDYRT